MNTYSIACVIVTFNRKALLNRCLHAVSRQTYQPTTVFIIDNASSDGTPEAVAQWGYYDQKVNGIDFRYHRCPTNGGGAAGFYTGLKLAFEAINNYDGFWVMDDDGEPDKECLEKLVPFLCERDYIAPVVLSDEDRKSCSFMPGEDYDSFCRRADDKGVVEGWASPFNGILYSRRLVAKIGYPKKEMFIWGDEINYQLRAERAGFHRMTVVKAIHYHPIDRQKPVRNADTLNATLIIPDVDWKLYCCIRNRVYNLMLEPRSLYRRIRMAQYLCKAYLNYYRVTFGNRSKDALIKDAFWSGLLGRFNGLNKYFPKQS